MSKKKETELTTMGEAEFLEKLECLAVMGYTSSSQGEMPFFILEDLIKLRRMEIKVEEAAA